MATTGAGAVCVRLTEQGFKKMSRARWHARAKLHGKLATDYRAMDFKKAKADIGEKHPGESKRDYRNRLIGLCSKAGRSGQRPYIQMTEQNKRRFVTAFREDEYHVEKISREPDYVPQYVNTPLFWTPERVIDFASQIWEGMDNYYLCRALDCRRFCPNTSWIQEFRALTNEPWVPAPACGWDHPSAELTDAFVDEAPPVSYDLGHYRCSTCTQEYYPWLPKSHLMHPNKLLVVSPNGDKELAKTMGMGPEDADMFFVRWETTSKTILAHRLKEIALDLCESTKQMTHEQLMTHCLAKINSGASRIFFQEHQLSKRTIHLTNRLNSGKDHNKQRWRYNHLLRGFYSAQALEYIKDVSVVLTDDDVCRHYAYTKMMCGISK